VSVNPAGAGGDGENRAQTIRCCVTHNGCKSVRRGTKVKISLLPIRYLVRLRTLQGAGSLASDMVLIRSAAPAGLTGAALADRVRNLIAAAEAGRHGDDTV